MRRFCPTCGKEIVRGTLCRACAKPAFAYAPIAPKFCVRCSRVFSVGKWSDASTLEDGIAKAAKNAIRATVTILEFNAPEVKGPGQNLRFEIPVYHGGGEFLIPATLETTICERCRTQGTKYFEAVLQIRPAREDVLEFVRAEIHKQEHKGVFNNKETEVEDGLDIEITNQTYAKVLAKKVTDHFGGTMKKNEKLFSRSRKTSRDIFRLAVKIELPLFSKGDMLVHAGKHYQITSTGKTLSLMDLETGQKTSLPWNDSHRNKYVRFESILVDITRIRPRLEILNPETFDSVPVENERTLLRKREESDKPIIDGEKLHVAFDADARVWGLL